MAKTKKKSAAKANVKSKSQSSSSSSHIRLATIGSAFLIAIVCCSVGGFHYYFKSWQNALSSILQEQPTTTTSTGDSFLKWFIENGGIFHPISTASNDDDPSNSAVQLSIQKFDGMGWGLAAIVNSTTMLLPTNNDETCNNNHESCSPQSPIIIPHLTPLFTVPRNLIISISSILDTYSSPSSEAYLPNFYHAVNKVLVTSFPRGPGLANMSVRNNVRMGLVEQDVVIAMMLMTEECLHNNQNSRDDSFWGPYLDMLPSNPIPRLDTFGDEEYEMLNDAVLERMGRSSKERLKSMFYGNDGSGGGDDISIRAVLRDMIHIQQRNRSARDNLSTDMTIPSSCLQFGNFHKFIGIVSSRAMVLKGIKYLTPLAEMINYAPVSPKDQVVAHIDNSDNVFDYQRVKSEDGMIHTPFDLYHGIGVDDSITVRSDRNVVLDYHQQLDDMTSSSTTTIQIFEDYGPVDSSLFLEMHAFVPDNNPHHCAVIHGRHFLRRPVAPGRSDPNLTMLLRALKVLHLTNPHLTQFESLEDVCVRKDMTIVEDGKLIGRRPASDAVAIMSLLLGESNEMFPNLELVKSTCIKAIESGDVDRIELQCARYPESGRAVKRALVNAAKRSVGEASVSLETLSSWLEEAQDQEGKGESGNEKMVLALRFRIEERKILDSIANNSVIDGESVEHVAFEASADDLDAKISSFNTFIDSLALPVNKIRAQAVEGMRIGAVATADLESEEAYISLPSHAVINAVSAVADAESSSPRLGSLLKKLDQQDGDGFDVLLVYLLHERFVRKEQSKWWPYLNLLPTVEEVRSSHPLFFEEDEMNLYLGGSDVRKFILRNQRRAFERHTALASDADVHTVLGSDVILDKSIVYWATAILDSRSIWWEGRRHLCPLLDLVNADTIGRAHETKLDGSSAVTRASRPVKRGEQVFENYQQPNYKLFSFHGFMLDRNPNDCALLAGLSNHNDPGRHASSTFCISGTNISSMIELVQFLRMKHGLSTNKLEPEAWLSDDVIPYLTQVLEERISRLGEIADLGAESTDDSIPQRQHFMSGMVKSDLTHFQGALELIKEELHKF